MQNLAARDNILVSEGTWFTFVVLSTTDQSHLSGICFHAGKQTMWRAKQAEYMGHNAVSEPIAI